VLNAGSRSADLTRQLLAFARKQTIHPKVLDLNDTITGMLKMLRRLIGEDIELAWVPFHGPCEVLMDPSQLDQILANLCVNARDAIGGVGKITIETCLAALDEAYCAEHTECIPGDYVVLTVTDNGCGMDEATKDRLFEPFFTTKGAGRGTGLGLATVYGIVRQNNGCINVYSEPGKGTAFRIYLPRHKAAVADASAETARPIPMGEGETVLVVEDEAAILRLCRIMLEELGYRVLAASTPGEAIRLATESGGRVDLLITDVIMPEMTGRDLAGQIAELCPGVKRLYMSGYTAEVIARHGVLNPGVSFVQKPFSKEDLAVKARKALGGAQEG